jgi:Protein of unknown function (DUF3175)
MPAKSYSQKSAASKSHKAGSKRRWSAQVTATSDATHPPEGLFKKSPAVISRTLASKRVSPKGAASGMRMLTFYINRAGSNLSANRRAQLERAKELLSKRVERERMKAA